MTHTADNTDRQETTVMQHLPEIPTDRIVLLGSNEDGTWTDITDQLVHVNPEVPGHLAIYEADNSGARFTRIEQETGSSVGGTTTSSEEQA